MNERIQPNLNILIAPLTVLMIVAIAVCLLAVLAGWLVNLPVRPALAVAQNPASTATPAPTNGALILSVTPEPTADPATLEPVVDPATVEPSPTPAPTSSLRSYTIRPGDTLGTIAQAYAVPVEDLIVANAITDPNMLYVGQVLTIPEAGAAPTPASPDVDPAQPAIVPSPLPHSAISEARWIDVDLTEQSLTAYEGTVPVHTTLVSTGLPTTPTPVGQFRIWIKFRYDDMAGPGYYIEDVPYVMYFHEGYGLHGVTWHGFFGHPMSHGCVNLPTSEAEWLFNWAEVGTLVNIHD